VTGFRSLGEFVAALEAAGELVRIKEPVSPDLEIAAIADRMMKSPGGGKALLFENVVGSTMPVLVNAYGSKTRMEMALGAHPDAIAARIEDLLHTKPPAGLTDMVKMLPLLGQLKSAIPSRKKSTYPPCQEVVFTGDAVDLTKIPVLTCWPDDGGPFVTLPCVVTSDPKTGMQNVGMYRLQIYDKKTTGMHWHIHKDGSAAYDEHKRLRKRMPVAVAIGTGPELTYAATAPLPRGIDEMMFAGFIRGKSIELAKCVTNDLWVPAEAEIVLEGFVEPAEERIEGPFGDHTGYYSPADPYPVFHVTAITHRRNPTYFTTVVGIPPMEDEWIGWATERLFLPLLKTQWPEVSAMYLPVEGAFHNLCIASMRKLYPRQARRLMSGFWGAGQMSLTKMIAVLDEDDRVNDSFEAARTILNRVRIPENLVWSEGVVDALDHSSTQPLWGGKLGIDATTPMAGEPGYGEELPANASGPAPKGDEVLKALSGEFKGLCDVRVPFDDTRLTLALLVLDAKIPHEGQALAKRALEIEGLDVAIVVEGEKDEALSRLAWRALASIDPTRDVHAVGAKLAVDATFKVAEEGYEHGRPWPVEVAHPAKVFKKLSPILATLGLEA
jgi:4-hydroxy-3-polyprenylbenzoate decarboxylase